MESAFIEVLTKMCNLSGAAQLSHWNVTGENFAQYHELFARVYETASGMIDPMAEQARGSKVEIPAKIFYSVPELEWSTEVELAKELYGVVEELQSALLKLHKESDDEGEYGILNIVEDNMSTVRTLLYLLGSTCGKL